MLTADLDLAREFVAQPDLLIAAAAEPARLTVLHIDKDYDLIAAITGQPVERLRQP